MSSRPIDPNVHRRLATAKRRLERLGLSRVPGYRAASGALGRLVFPTLRRESGHIPIAVHGVTLDIQPDQVVYYVHHEHEPLTTAAFLAAIEPGGVIIDVGANIGYYTCLAGRALGGSGRVHAIEPVPSNLELLERNIAGNGLGNVTVHRLAAATESGTRVLHVTRASGHHGFYAHELSPTLHQIDVATAAVDDLVDARACVIKIDVEGAEPEALRGMRETLRRSPGATLFLEWNPSALQHAGEDPLGLPDLLRSLGARPVAAFDEWNVTELSVEQVRAGLTDGSLPMDWAWNIKAVVGS